MNTPGYNPIQWNCIVSGCFNYHKHFDIELFAQCFPRNISLTDLDGFVELNHHFLITEFKDKAADLTQGQRLAFERLTSISERITIVVVRCDYRSSEVFSVKVIKRGLSGPWQDCDLDGLITRIVRWSNHVTSSPAKPVVVADNTRGTAA